MKISEKLLEIEKNNDLILDKSYLNFIRELKRKIPFYQEYISKYEIRKISCEEEFKKNLADFDELDDINSVLKYVRSENFDSKINEMNRQIEDYREQFLIYNVFSKNKNKKIDKNLDVMPDNIKNLDYYCSESLKNDFDALLENLRGKVVPYFEEKNNYYEFSVWNDLNNGKVNPENANNIKNLFQSNEKMLFSGENYMKLVLKLEKYEKEVQNEQKYYKK